MNKGQCHRYSEYEPLPSVDNGLNPIIECLLWDKITNAVATIVKAELFGVHIPWDNSTVKIDIIRRIVPANSPTAGKALNFVKTNENIWSL